MTNGCIHVQAFQQYIEPTMQYADIVVPRGGQNRVAVQLIVEHVKDQLKQVLASPIPVAHRLPSNGCLCVAWFQQSIQTTGW